MERINKIKGYCKPYPYGKPMEEQNENFNDIVKSLTENENIPWHYRNSGGKLTIGIKNGNGDIIIFECDKINETEFIKKESAKTKKQKQAETKETEECIHCAGYGMVKGDDCWFCEGTGLQKDVDRLLSGK